MPDSASLEPRTRIRLVPVVVACALFMENLDSTILTTALPQIARSMNEDPLHLSLAITSYLLSLAIFIPLSGWMADRYGARTVFRNAIVVFVIGSLGCAASHHIGSLVCARLLQGLGGAMMVPVGRLVLLREVPKRELVGAMSIVTIPALMAPILGPPVGGFIVSVASWHWIFLINLPIGVVGWLLVTRYVRDIAVTQFTPLDLAGWWLIGGGVGALVLGFESLGKHVLPDPVPALGIAAGVVLVALYVRHARRERWPVLDTKLLRIPTFRASLTGGSLFRLGVGSFTLLLPMMLQLPYGLSPLASGLITFTSAVGAMAMKTIAQKVTRRYGFRRLLTFNTVVCSLALAACGRLTPAWPWAVLGLFLAGTGFLRSLQFTCINALAYADVEEKDMSQAASFASTAQQLALSVGVGVGAQALNLSESLRHGTTLAVVDFNIAFLAAAALSLCALFSFRALAPEAGEAVSGHKLALATEPQTTADD